MSNALAKVKLGAPVGQDPRPSKGKPVKNAPADVLLTRKLLMSAGVKIKLSKAANDEFIESIKKFQKKNGFTNPDGVIDPGKKTFNTLIKAASKKADDAGEKIDVYIVKIGGKEYPMSEKDYQKAVAETAKKLERIVIAMRGQYQTIQANAQWYIDAATGANGFMDSLVAWSSSLVTNLPPPNFSKGPAAYGAVRRAEAAIKSHKIKVALDELQKAKKALNEYAAEVQKYGDRICGGAKTMQEGLEFTRDTSFEIAGYIASALLVSRGANPTAAKAGTGAVMGLIKSSATQYGRSLAGYKDTPGDHAAAIILDTVAGGVKGGLNAKYVDKFGDKVGAYVISKPPFSTMGKAAVKKIVCGFMEGAGKQAVTEAFEGALAYITKAGKAALSKNKKFNWKGELEKAATDAIFKVVTAGALKNFEGAQKKLGGAFQKVSTASTKDMKVLTKLGLTKSHWFKALPAGEQVKHFTKIAESLVGNTSNEGLKRAWGAAVDGLKGTESPDKIAQEVAKNAMKDDKFLAEMKKKFAALEKKAGKR